MIRIIIIIYILFKIYKLSQNKEDMTNVENIDYDGEAIATISSFANDLNSNKNLGNITTSNITNTGKITSDTVLLKNKYNLVGGIGTDNWLRVMNTANTGYYGGLAAGNLYPVDNAYTKTLTASGNINTNKLCIGGTCLNENDIKLILNNNKYGLGPVDNSSCPSNMVHINSKEECHNAYNVLHNKGFDYHLVNNIEYQNGNSNWRTERPKGCFVHRGNHNVHFNQDPTGGHTSGQDQAICIKPKS